MADGDKKAHLHDLEERLFEVLDEFHGSISAEHGIGRKKQAPYLARLSPIERELISGVKALFDPKGLMNPGRILPAKEH